MRANAVAADEQYRLIMECRTSGMTDYQWCMEHDIKPGTFYNWVKRLRKRGVYDIPDARSSINASKQEVVRVEIAPSVSEIPSKASEVISEYVSMQTPVMEVVINGAAVRISNGIAPALLECAIRLLKEAPC